MMPCANPVQKFNSAKLILLDGLIVQESARSLAVLTLIEVGSLVGAVGAAAWVGEPKARAAQTISMNRIGCLRIDHDTADLSRRAYADIDRLWPSTIQLFDPAEGMCSGAKGVRGAAPECLMVK